MERNSKRIAVCALGLVIALAVFASMRSVLGGDGPLPVVQPGPSARTEDAPEPHPVSINSTTGGHTR